MLRLPGRLSSCRASKLAVIAVDCESMVEERGRTLISSLSQASWRVTSTVAVEPTPTNTLRETVSKRSRVNSSVYVAGWNRRETISPLVVRQRRARAHQRLAGDLYADPGDNGASPVEHHTVDSTRHHTDRLAGSRRRLNPESGDHYEGANASPSHSRFEGCYVSEVRRTTQLVQFFAWRRY